MLNEFWIFFSVSNPISLLLLVDYACLSSNAWPLDGPSTTVARLQTGQPGLLLLTFIVSGIWGSGLCSSPCWWCILCFLARGFNCLVQFVVIRLLRSELTWVFYYTNISSGVKTGKEVGSIRGCKFGYLVVSGAPTRYSRYPCVAPRTNIRCVIPASVRYPWVRGKGRVWS